MRYSFPDLTMLARAGENVYADPPSPAHAGLRRARPSLLDVASALDVLPELSLDGAPDDARAARREPGGESTGGLTSAAADVKRSCFQTGAAC